MNDMERRTFCAALSRYGAQAQITMAFKVRRLRERMETDG